MALDGVAVDAVLVMTGITVFREQVVKALDDNGFARLVTPGVVDAVLVWINGADANARHPELYRQGLLGRSMLVWHGLVADGWKFPHGDPDGPDWI